MKTIAHISDLHFGRLEESTLPALRVTLTTLRPDLVVVSGDLTQRARKRQFRDARTFLDTLPGPQIIVPGNHDVPLYNVLARWLSPLKNYRRYIESTLLPSHADGEIAVLGLNTARSLTIKDGRLNTRQMRDACEFFARHKTANMRILVTHHPFDVADPSEQDNILGRAPRAVAEFSACGVDMILTGHLHGAHVSNTAQRYGADSRILLVQAGTATSTRLRNEANTWNVIRVSEGVVSVQVMTWQAGTKCFVPGPENRFLRSRGGWETLA
ncbi:MAG: metallophosphoesterase [Alphaproteobacteria bacterium]|nr:metallophosphoesterase [Alphaproteobacteria bacterium]